MKPKAVLAYCREKGIRAFDLRYIDLVGEWRHVSFPIASLTENLFEEGIGQEAWLVPGSSEHPYAILLPDSEANYLDPFTEQPTLVMAASVQDVVQRQECELDSRFVVAQALRYVQSTAVADDVQVRTALRFGDGAATRRTNGERRLPAELDTQFLDRNQISNYATEAGLQVDRHLVSSDGASEILLKPASVLTACDDAVMLRYLIANHLRNVSGSGSIGSNWNSSQWSFIRNGEAIFTDGTYHGISEAGLFAQGGLVKHSVVLSSIYLLALSDSLSVTYPFTNSSTGPNARSICRESRSASSPREMVVELNSVPSLANYYLAYAATMMAMVDGILNRYLPTQFENELSGNALADDLHVWKREEAAAALRSDWEFLNRGDVFSEELLKCIRELIGGAR